MGASWYKSWTGLNEFYNQFIEDRQIKLERPIDKNIPFMDAANVLRIGLDMIFLVSESANEESYRFFRKFIEEKYDNKVRIHATRDIYKGIHIDTTITLIGWNEKLQKYLVLVDAEKLNPCNMPAIFRGKNWAVVQSPELIEFETIKEITFTSPKLAENFVAVNSQLMICDEKQAPLIKLFKHYGIDVIATPNPYGRELCGGFHCMTNDYNRVEDKDFAKILTSEKKDLPKSDLAGYFDADLLELLSSKGDLDEWNNICNEEGIFPTYITEHMSKEDVELMNERHELAKRAINN